jgi:hypothetical protein
MLDEGAEDQRPCRDHRDDPERVGFGQLADSRAIVYLCRQHGKQPAKTAFDPFVRIFCVPITGSPQRPGVAP